MLLSLACALLRLKGLITSETILLAYLATPQASCGAGCRQDHDPLCATADCRKVCASCSRRALLRLKLLLHLALNFTSSEAGCRQICDPHHFTANSGAICQAPDTQ